MIDQILAFTLPAAYWLLPAGMQSAEASAMVLAVGLQESRFQFRRQLGGPARGFWQFEIGGVRAVLNHQRTSLPLTRVLRALQYEYDNLADADLIQSVVEHNDVLAACFARCLLWASPLPLVGPNEPEAAWGLYLDAWRPGKPHRALWDGFYEEAWTMVLGHRPEQELKA